MPAKQIWKFSYPLADIQADVLLVPVPPGSRLLSVANQREELVVYALVDPAVKRRVDVPIRVAGTGHPISLTPNDRFLGTALFMDGKLVLHVFELGT